MSKHYLFGPVGGQWADEHLSSQIQAGECVPFGPGAGWADLLGGRPDFIAIAPEHASIPETVWEAPVPIVAVVGKWRRQWHRYRRQLRGCELVVTDEAGTQALAREGFTNVRAVPGCERWTEGANFQGVWSECLELIEREWGEIAARVEERRKERETERRRERETGRWIRTLLTRTWQALAMRDGGDAELARDLAAVLVREPRSGTVHNALALVEAAAGRGNGLLTGVLAEKTADGFRRALQQEPGHAIAGLNLAEILIALRQDDAAGAQARRTLSALNSGTDLDPLVWESAPFTPVFGRVWSEWERAAWSNAGDTAAEIRAKRDVLRWRLHTIIADLKGDLVHFFEAAEARRDLPAAQAALGCALGRARRFPEAVSHLRQAVAGDPFDREAARALFGALGETGDGLGQRRLAHERRLLAQAEPQRVPPEKWFMDAPGVGEAEERREGEKERTREGEKERRREGEKEGQEAVANHIVVAPGGASLPGPAVAAPALAPGFQKISVCIIARDEEKNLPVCLESIRPLVEEGLIGEVIVNDTGSRDLTMEIARAVGCKVLENIWQDSFALARNQAIEAATCPFIFWVDADDYVPPESLKRLRELILSLRDENVAFRMECQCLADPVSRMTTNVDHVRLFRNRADIRFEFRVHEQILGPVRRSGAQVVWSDVVIHHTGYQDPALRRRKLERDLRLLKLMEAEDAEHPYVLFNLGQVYQELGQTGEAIPYLRRSIEGSQPGDSIVRKLYALLVQCHRSLGQRADAQACCSTGRHYYPDDAELLFQEAILAIDRKDWVGAEGASLRLIGGQEAAHFGSTPDGLRGFRARQNLAVVYRAQGRQAEAEAQWRAVLAEREDFRPAWLGLGELYLGQKRWAEIEDVVRRLDDGSGDGLDVTELRARGHLGRQEFGAARGLLEAGLARLPESARLWEVLSHALLQEGKDWAAAERALRRVLELQPGNEEARRNLELLLRQHGATTR